MAKSAARPKGDSKPAETTSGRSQPRRGGNRSGPSGPTKSRAELKAEGREKVEISMTPERAARAARHRDALGLAAGQHVALWDAMADALDRLLAAPNGGQK